MKLTKQDIDKVRHIEGFPIAKDEDIIALSRPPYYTACPNPFIEDFIRDHGTPYDEATDDYHQDPFAADVSEGKNDPIYNAHSYHTKVPYKAIMRYILHYTKPGDLVLDGFCGTGMTGVAAQMCGCPDLAFKAQLEQEMEGDHIEWGTRHAILNDLSPAATFISHSYNSVWDVNNFSCRAKKVLSDLEDRYGWMYETFHTQDGKTVTGIDGKPIMGRIVNVIWSDVFICPSCSHRIVFWKDAIDHEVGCVKDVFSCPTCHSELTKRDCKHALITELDPFTGETYSHAETIPVVTNYVIGTRRYAKTPDQHDIDILKRISEMVKGTFVPVHKWQNGEKTEEPIRLGYGSVHQMYTTRNAFALSLVYVNATKQDKQDLLFLLTGMLIRSTRMSRVHIKKFFFGGGGWNGGNLAGTLYVPSTPVETSVFDQFRERLSMLERTMNTSILGDALVTTQSTTDLAQVPENSVDYIFTDPPFGNNINYSELNTITEAWLGVFTNSKQEAIMSSIQKKGLAEYQELMQESFNAYYRVLKPCRWLTVEFHNSKNSVWNAIQEGLSHAGFIVADVRTINKQQGSFNQVNATGAVQQDLVISAYKPKESFIREFRQRAGDPEMAWEFVRQHLANVPVAPDGNNDGKIDMVAERCSYLLFDRMVAYHIMNGIPVPMDAHTFYEGLHQRFLMRDGMFFLSDQVNAYDEKRLHMDLDITQSSFVVTDEKNAIQWLNYILKDNPQTYQDIQPLYLQELHQEKREMMPELLDMLRDNFVQDEEARFYIPDLRDAADLAKLRTKKMLKEFYDSYVPGRGKLKAFRKEAIRAGFDDCWNKRDYKTIISVGERLPDVVLQEDPALLMYYDNACVRG